MKATVDPWASKPVTLRSPPTTTGSSPSPDSGTLRIWTSPRSSTITSTVSPSQSGGWAPG